MENLLEMASKILEANGYSVTKKTTKNGGEGGLGKKITGPVYVELSKYISNNFWYLKWYMIDFDTRNYIKNELKRIHGYKTYASIPDYKVEELREWMVEKGKEYIKEHCDEVGNLYMERQKKEDCYRRKLNRERNPIMASISAYMDE